MLNISSKQELSSRIALQLLLHPMMWLDAAPYGSSSCIVNTAFQFFFYFKFDFTKFIKSLFLNVPFWLGSDPDPGSGFKSIRIHNPASFSHVSLFLSVLRIWIRKDPHHLAGSGFGILDADPDPRLQNCHLINILSTEK
jgi:hypothetical protein